LLFLSSDERLAQEPSGCGRRENRLAVHCDDREKEQRPRAITPVVRHGRILSPLFPRATRPLGPKLHALFMKGCRPSRASGSFFFFCFSAVLIGWTSRAARQGLRRGCSTLNNLFVVSSSSSAAARSCTGGGLIRPTYSFVNTCLPGTRGSPAATRSRPVRAAQLPRGLKPARQGP